MVSLLGDSGAANEAKHKYCQEGMRNCNKNVPGQNKINGQMGVLGLEGSKFLL